MERHVRVTSGLNMLLGLWLTGAPFMFNYSGKTAEVLNEMIVGGIVLLLAAIRFFNPMRFSWMSWVNAALGAWLIVAPFVLSASAGGSAIILVDDMVVGAAIVIFGVWSALAARGAIEP